MDLAREKFKEKRIGYNPAAFKKQHQIGEV
jgi:hypothetical protein